MRLNWKCCAIVTVHHLTTAAVIRAVSRNLTSKIKLRSLFWIRLFLVLQIFKLVPTPRNLLDKDSL